MRTLNLLIFLAVAAMLFVPATASAAFEHVVAPGETLTSVAATDGLTVGQLAAANGISPDSQLIAGTSLAIPPQSEAPVAPAESDEGSSATEDPATSYAATAPVSDTSTGGYLVQPGDTLTAIAARYGLTVDQLAADNGLDPAGLLLSGTTLSVSGGSAATETADTSAPAQTEDVSTTPASSSASSGAQPTDEYVSPSEVGSIASANGVPASLAEAIGYQESGFNNAEVSDTGATGVMQIEPGTWSYIGQNLAGPPPLSPDSAADNIRAGSLLLHSLLNQTGGNAALTAAAYYQGLPSVEQHGEYADTQQYVNDVMALQQRFGGQ